MQNNYLSHAGRMLTITSLYGLTASVFYMLFTTHYIPSDRFDGLRLAIFLLMAPIFIKYIVQLVFAPCYSILNRRLRHADQTDPAPVTVLIPAWNEEIGIIKTIQSVINTHYAKLEIIVINDGSSDRTHELVSAFIRRYESAYTGRNMPVSLKYLSLKNGGKAKALNQGLEHATGEFIITIDADSVMDQDMITKIMRQFSDQETGAVAGNVIVANRRKPIELLQQLEYLYGFFFKRADSVFGAVYIIGGAAAAYRKFVLQKLGGFDEKIITEDIEMSTRILANGYKTRYAADAVVYTEGPGNFSGLCQQRLRWKHGRLLTFIKHKQLFFNLGLGKPYLTCLLLPIAIYAELSLLLEGLLLTIFYGYTIYTNDYLPLALVITFMSMLVCLQIAFDSKARFHRNMLVLAPVAWVVFYVIDAVELQALCRSVKRLVKRENLEWQPWIRAGLFNKHITPQNQLTIQDCHSLELDT